MFEEYNKPKSVYYVENNGKVVGSASRSLKMKQQLFVNCRKCIFTGNESGDRSQVMAVLQSAKDFGFENCYLETMPFMHDAQKLYKKVGLNTLMLHGYGTCLLPVWMLKKL
jgi:putative acetyltransferase